MEVNNKLSKDKIREKLSDFKSSNKTYVHSISGNWKLMLSEGCFFVREMARAGWLFDLILSYQSSTVLKNEDCQEWNIRRIRSSGYLQIICRNDKREILLAKLQKVRKFPLDELTVCLTGNLARLKSELGDG